MVWVYVRIRRIAGCCASRATYLPPRPASSCGLGNSVSDECVLSKYFVPYPTLKAAASREPS